MIWFLNCFFNESKLIVNDHKDYKKIFSAQRQNLRNLMVFDNSLRWILKKINVLRLHMPEVSFFSRNNNVPSSKIHTSASNAGRYWEKQNISPKKTFYTYYFSSKRPHNVAQPEKNMGELLKHHTYEKTIHCFFKFN